MIFHSDRGSLYASKDFRDVLAAYGSTASMSRRGNCWHNACSETLFGSLKVERLAAIQDPAASDGRSHCLDALVQLGYVSPVQFEEHWLAKQPRLACA